MTIQIAVMVAIVIIGLVAISVMIMNDDNIKIMKIDNMVEEINRKSNRNPINYKYIGTSRDIIKIGGRRYIRANRGLVMVMDSKELASKYLRDNGTVHNISSVLMIKMKITGICYKSKESENYILFK